MAGKSLKQSLTALEGQLASLDTGQLRAGLARYASALSAARREAFLADLSAAFQTVGTGGAEPTVPAAGDPSLLADIDAFVAELAAEEYRGNGYSGYRGRYDDWDDDEDTGWVEPLDTLFAAAGQVFLDGDLPLARDAYARLFEAVRAEDDEGSLFGERGFASDLLDTDVLEAALRFLRAVYETVDDPAERAGALADAWLSDLPYGCEPKSLTDLREIVAGDLPDLDAFAPHWTAQLTERSITGGYGGGHAVLRKLLTEAALASGGTDGLGQVARAGGASQCDAYAAWIAALREAERPDAAEEACREALAVAPRTEDFTRYLWASIADQAAALAQKRGDTRAELGHRHQAWDLAPDTDRMCAMFAAAEHDQAGTGPQAVAGAVDRLFPDLDRTRPDYRHTGRLLAQGLLLAGSIDQAIGLLPARVDAPEDLSGTLLPYLLAAGAEARTVTGRVEWPSTVLRDLISGTGRDRQADPRPAKDGTRPERHDLGALLLELLPARASAITPMQRRALLVRARAGVDLFVKRIVGGQQRGSYDQAARLAAACAEALIMTGEDRFYLEGIRASYPRHSAFRKEIDKAQAGSALL